MKLKEIQKENMPTEDKKVMIGIDTRMTEVNTEKTVGIKETGKETMIESAIEKMVEIGHWTTKTGEERVIGNDIKKTEIKNTTREISIEEMMLDMIRRDQKIISNMTEMEKIVDKEKTGMIMVVVKTDQIKTEVAEKKKRSLNWTK